ncbi:MAG: DUF1508 domain-containing protein [Candidatus Borkfalkiaceae bacterium]|nr:DUF1508 domain-containing protein [Christensenellaceae bacterium]
MKAIIDFVKTNLPIIAAVLAFGVAAVIGAYLIVRYVKNKKKNAEKPSVTDENFTAKPETEEITRADENGADDLVAATDTQEENSMKDKKTEAAKQPKVAPKAEEKKPMKTAAKPAVKEVKPTAKATEKTAKPASKTVAAKTTAKPAAKKAEPVKDAKTAVGKWIIKEKGDGEFVAFLYANNGEIMLTSEIYTSEESARAGIDTIRKNVDGGTFVNYKDKNKNYYFKLKSVKNRILCVSETYKSEALAESAKESVKRFVSSPVQSGVEKDITVIKYVLPKKEEPVDTRSAYSGKWKIEKDGDTYMAKLFASNGELLLNSESYVSYASAKSAISTIVTNGVAGNFIIDSDKKGRYFFKLRSAQKATLCIGETYAKLDSCQSAIESVRRFLKTAKLIED